MVQSAERICRISESAVARLYGAHPSRGTSWGWKQTVHPDDLDRVVGKWLQILASGDSGELEARVRRCDGEYRWFLLRAEPLRDMSGKIVRWYGVNTDIEERRRAESLLSAEKRTLEMVARGAVLKDILENLCLTVEAQIPNVICTVLLIWSVEVYGVLCSRGTAKEVQIENLHSPLFGQRMLTHWRKTIPAFIEC